jgi:hypothetical protein
MREKEGTTNTAISNNLYWLADENLSIDEGQGENNFLLLWPDSFSCTIIQYFKLFFQRISDSLVLFHSYG